MKMKVADNLASSSSSSSSCDELTNNSPMPTTSTSIATIHDEHWQSVAATTRLDEGNTNIGEQVKPEPCWNSMEFGTIGNNDVPSATNISNHSLPQSSTSASDDDGANGTIGARTHCSRSSSKNSRPGGLSDFSRKVVEVVRRLGSTTTCAMTNELLKEYRRESPTFDEKNVRRRIYDALNVLCAIGVIRKGKNNIAWRGLVTLRPTTDAQRSIDEQQKRVRNKTQKLVDVARQYLALQCLVERNQRVAEVHAEEKLFLPFIVINCPADADIQCEIADDRQSVFCDYSRSFVIHDDAFVTQKLWAREHAGIDSVSVLPVDLQNIIRRNEMPSE